MKAFACQQVFHVQLVDVLKKDVLKDRIGGNGRETGLEVGDELLFEGKSAWSVRK